MIEQQFRDKVCEQIHLRPEGNNRYRVFTPFRFQDGDHLSIILKGENSHWVLTDEGHTYLHLTYEIDEADLQRGTRQQIISNALAAFEVDEVDSELSKRIPDDAFGDALYSYVQALLKITDVAFLSRERVRSTFLQDLSSFLLSFTPEDRIAADWHDPEIDPESQYMADYRLNGMDRPLMIYALPNDDKTRDATITLLKYETWNLKFQSLGIFEDQEAISRKVLARFTDVVDRQFSSLSANRERIQEHVQHLISRAS